MDYKWSQELGLTSRFSVLYLAVMREELRSCFMLGDQSQTMTLVLMEDALISEKVSTSPSPISDSRQCSITNTQFCIKRNIIRTRVASLCVQVTWNVSHGDSWLRGPAVSGANNTIITSRAGHRWPLVCGRGHQRVHSGLRLQHHPSGAWANNTSLSLALDIEWNLWVLYHMVVH